MSPTATAELHRFLRQCSTNGRAAGAIQKPLIVAQLRVKRDQTTTPTAACATGGFITPTTSTSIDRLHNPEAIRNAQSMTQAQAESQEIQSSAD